MRLGWKGAPSQTMPVGSSARTERQNWSQVNMRGTGLSSLEGHHDGGKEM